jgi:uncharacterized protein YpbB
LEVGEAYNNGQTIQELMDQYKVQRATILDHLARFALEGTPLRRGEDLQSLVDLPLERQLAALKAFEELGAQALKPVFEKLNSEISYEDLKILRLHFLSRQNNP